ncbi:hypothetical protein FB45DRAFT_1065515 [Roridomyces roridus]|uniref:BTB domain-containing protein n=1 Tax=Roridomyces roridus TaxID=1738132 RepID=A0AAD7B765_9AGAR|nr:hypothetical protein FB45DRAFT_1065515 [Roridomyces roridus]
MTTTTTDPQALQRADGLWFEDGNIVIEAENTQFRVYHGLLAAASPVFKDMMALPRPPDSELVEGCLFVQLHDSALDATVFLLFFPSFPIQVDFRTVFGCLRLGHKYEVDFLRRRALIHLSSVCDTQLDRFDRSTQTLNNADSVHDVLDTVSMRWTAPITLTSISIPIIQLAREVDALWLLPNSFYNISYGFSNFSTPNTWNLAGKVVHGAEYDGSTVRRLSPQDQESFLVGHTMQCKGTGDVTEFLSLPADIPGCLSPESCARERFKVIGASRARAPGLASHPLSVWGPVQWALLKDLCQTCRRTLETKHKAARQAFWDKLPEMYGLPSWDELEKMKIAAIGKDWLSQNGGS